MNLAWRLRRVRAMGAAEITFRAGRLAGALAERAMLPMRGLLPPRFAQAPRSAPTARAPDRPWLSRDTGIDDPAPYVAAAERVLAGRIALFGEAELEVGFPPRWNREPKTGIDIPLSFGKTLNYRDPARVGDVKYVWELNRHPQLVALAQAWHQTRDARYAAACCTLLDSWIAQNPCPLGINWTCSLEPALRLLNWSAAWHLLGGEQSPLFAGQDGAAFRARWLDSVWQHCRFIAGYLSRHSSANNHLIGELLGLYAGAATWPLWPESGRWLRESQAELEHEALLQNGADGVNREQAIYYHRSVLEMLLIAGLISRASGPEFSAAYWQRLERMLDVLASVMDAGGHVPSIGDEDGAIAVTFAPEGIADPYRSVLATGAVLFARADLRCKAGEFDVQNHWLMGRDAATRFEQLPADTAELPPRRAFEEGGWYVLGDRFETPDEVRLVADVGPLGYLGIAAHGHADALACTLSVGGELVLVDAGTYGYYIENHWRDYFRSTAAHNTLRVDGLDQSESGGAFLWMQHARTTRLGFSSTPGADSLEGEHDGYTRLADPVTHRRRFDYDKSSRVLAIHDSLACAGEHLVEQFWHLPAALELRVEGHRVQARTARHQITFSLPADGQVRHHNGSREPLAGWRSARFGTLQPCHTLVVSRRIQGPWQAITTLSIEPIAA
jgi:hypothetical protein